MNRQGEVDASLRWHDGREIAVKYNASFQRMLESMPDVMKKRVDASLRWHDDGAHGAVAERWHDDGLSLVLDVSNPYKL